jgi:ferredoxin
MTKYKVLIERKDCILCGNCYSLDPKHFEPDNEYRSMVVNGETTEDISQGTFDDDGISLAKQSEEECPAEIISVKEL